MKRKRFEEEENKFYFGCDELGSLGYPDGDV